MSEQTERDMLDLEGQIGALIHALRMVSLELTGRQRAALAESLDEMADVLEQSHPRSDYVKLGDQVVSKRHMRETAAEVRRSMMCFGDIVSIVPATDRGTAE